MRASFGGASDLSQQLAFFYSQYQDRLTELTNRASNRAQDEEAATDQDKINAWQSGDISDKEIIAYLQGRIADGTNDPKVTTQLKDALRNVQDSISQQTISDTAQSIIDGIENGTKTWNDLRNFYTAQRKKYRPNDPIYQQITDQINQVNDRIRDNDISGGIERATYLFQNHQMTGKQAGAAIRNLAARYKNEDPAKYYQLLQQATQLEQYGNSYYSSGSGGSGGRGGSGGSGGSSGGAKNINSLIDQYQAMRNALLSQSQQFEDGRTVGTDSDGNTYLLANPDGTPSQQMEAIDQQALDTFDLLTEAYRSKGDYSAAESTAAAKQNYISDHIQPRNTIAPQLQRDQLLAGISKQVQLAGEGSDPAGSAAAVRGSLNAYRKWVENLNTEKTFRAVNKVERADVVGNPEGRRALATADQTTADFVKESQTIYNAIEQSIATGDPLSLDGIDIPEGMAAQLNPLLQGTAQLSQVLNGLNDGSWVWFDDPINGLHPTPTITDVGPDGQPVRIPVDANGNRLVPAGVQLAAVAIDVAGKPTAAFAPVRQSMIWNGEDIYDNTTGQVLVRHGEQIDQSTIKQLKAYASDGRINPIDESQTATMQQIVVKDGDGNTQTWFGRQGSDGQTVWTKNKLSDNPRDFRPAPIIADSDRAAQEIADKLGIDPNGGSYYKIARPAAGTERKGGFKSGVDEGFKPPQAQQQGSLKFPSGNDALGQNPMFNFQPGAGQGRGAGGSFADKLVPVAKQLGIRGGFFENADRTTSLPKIGKSAPNVRRGGMFEGADLNVPNVRVAPVNIAPLRIRPVNLHFDLPEPQNIYNPIKTATGRKGGFIK